MQPLIEVYLNIKTTGPSARHSEVTTIGIHLCNRFSTDSIQLIGDNISGVGIIETVHLQ